MTESYAVFVRVQQLLKKIFARINNAPTDTTCKHETSHNTNTSNTSNSNCTTDTSNNSNNSNPINTTNCDTKSGASKNIEFEEFIKNVVLFDVCSGKGYAATLLAFMFPTMQVSSFTSILYSIFFLLALCYFLLLFIFEMADIYD